MLVATGCHFSLGLTQSHLDQFSIQVLAAFVCIMVKLCNSDLSIACASGPSHYVWLDRHAAAATR